LLPKKLSKIRFELYPKQRLAFDSRATEQLFGGASEGGKSYYGRCATAMWSACIPNLQTRIFRKHYADVIAMMDGLTGYPELLRPWVRDKFVKITENEVQFDNGALIQLHGMLHKKDLEKHQGLEKHVLWIDESTQILAEYIKGLRGWVRMPEEMKKLLPLQLAGIYPHLTPEQRREMFPRVLLTANPIGASVGYHRRAFVQAAPAKELHYAPDNDGGFLRQYVPSRIEDNPSADPEAQRKRLAALGEQTAAAMIGGVWDSPTGDFFKEYDDVLHVVPDHKPASHLFKFRTFDWGSNDPACCLWWYVADSETMVAGRHIPRGALVCYREWYICDAEDMSKGIHMRNEDIARGIVSRTHEAMSGITLSDNFPFADRGGSKNGVKFTMADDFFEHGCPLTLGNTARVYGWKQLRSRLQGFDSVPMIYWVESCVACRTYIPAIGFSETNSEDAAEDGEATHAPDPCRLACTARPLTIEAPKDPERRHKDSSMSPQSILTTLKRTNGGGSFGSRR
jgi:hypothetical protein